MASIAAILSILVDANTSKARAELVKLNRDLTKSEAKAKNIRVAAGAAGLVLGGAFAIGAKSGFDELKKGQKVTAQTNAVLKSTGGVAKVTAKHVDDLGNSILKKSGIDDEAIRTGENMLLTFTKVRNEAGKGNKIFDRTTQAIADMATAMNNGAVPSGEQFKRTAIQVGKALQDPVKGATALRRVGVALTAEQQDQIKTMVGLGNAADDLKQVGIQLTTKQKEQIITLGDQANPLKAAADLNLKLSDAQRKTIQSMLDGSGQMKAQKVILGELNKEFGGSATAAGKTLSGQMDILRETFRNLAASVVQAVIPAMQALLAIIQPLVDFMTKHKTATKVLTGALVALAVALGVVAVSEKTYAASSKIATAATWLFNDALIGTRLQLLSLTVQEKIGAVAAKVLAAAQWLLNAALTANPIALVVVALAALGVGVVIAYKKFKPFRDAVNGAWGILKDTFDWAKKHWPLLASILGGPLVAAGIQIAKHFGSIKDAVVGFINDIITLIDKLPFVNIPHIGGGSKTVGNPNIPHQKLAKGGFVNKPIAIMGEEAPAHPEWVVPTNPAYRRRAISLWASAGHDIGVPGFASGGLLGKAGSIVKSVTGAGLPSNPLKGTFLAKMGGWILDKAAHYITKKASSGLGAVGGALKGLGGGATVHGLLPRVLRALAWARGHGWHGSVTSGYRSHASQQYLWDHAAQLGLIRGVSVARPGTSSHEMGAAVDVTDIAAFRKAMGSAPPDSRLLWRGLSDPVHFSITGHKKGGLLKFAKGGLYGASMLAGLASQAGFSKGSIPLAVAIALAESGGRAGASNRNSDGSIDRGLWQINSTHGALSTFNPLANARAAYAISHGGHDWKPWTVFRTGAYKKFLTRAYRAVGGVKRHLAAVKKKVGLSHTGGTGSTHRTVAALPTFTSTPTSAQIAADALTATQGTDIGNVQHAIANVQGHLKAGDITPEQANTQTGAILTSAINGGYGSLSEDDILELRGELKDNTDSMDSLIAAQQAQTDALNALKDEVKRQNDFASSVAAVTSMQAIKALSDVISGQIVGVGYRGRALTASAGQTVRY